MVLSVVLYKHKLTPGQWAGAAIVFAGISVEAWVKRKGVHHRILIPQLSIDSLLSLRGARKASHSREGEGKNKVAIIILLFGTAR
jgi:hypothetical protein